MCLYPFNFTAHFAILMIEPTSISGSRESRRIITATCSHFPNVSSEVERSLLDYAFVLFGEEWLRLVKEDKDEYDREEELEAASKVFFQIYKTEKDVW